MDITQVVDFDRADLYYWPFFHTRYRSDSLSHCTKQGRRIVLSPLQSLPPILLEME